MMKKLIAVLAFLAMVTTASFAQVSINGMFGFRADIMSGTTDFDDGMNSLGRAYDHDARFGMNVGNGEGTAGAGFRSWVGVHDAEGGGQLHAWAWWQPLDNLRITVGRDPWRFYGQGQIVGWAFNANNSEDWLLGWGEAGGYHYGDTQRGARLGRNAGFYAGFGSTGISATFQPVEHLPLTLIAALPFAGVDNEVSATGHWAADTFLNAHVGFRYMFAGIGQLSFTWWGAPGHWGWAADGSSPFADPGNINVGALSGTNQTNSSRAFLSFHLTAIPGIQVNIGLVYTLPFEVMGNEPGEDPVTGAPIAQGVDVRTNFPLEIGLGFLYSQGSFRIATRLAATFAGSQRHTTPAFAAADQDDSWLAVDHSVPIPLQLGFTVHPQYNLGPVTLHLNAGIQFRAAGTAGQTVGYVGRDADGDPIGGVAIPAMAGGADNAMFGFHATPYVMRMIASPTRIFAGLHVTSFDVSDLSNNLRWRVPVGIQFEW